ncbi:unnamed protein product [Bemisia tabaci]|uniref:Gustatory receptor n=1 Tax=Bemisia tabaci TaxID=7038 RepID=A0A9P0CAZ4_BEMTA|nr:unnamed protein product [Bemisia tabaci]
MTIISGVMLIHVYTYAYLLTGDFLIKIETYVSCTVMMTTLVLPFTYLVESRQFGAIFRSWNRFQRHFKLRTGTFIDLRIVKLYSVLHVAFFLFIFVQLLLQAPTYIPDLFIFRLAYSYPYVQILLVYILSHVSLKAASIASREYNVQFQKMMARGQAEELEPFRLLWLELSSLMRESGNLYHNTTSLDNFVPIMVGLILHLYRLILVFPKRAVRAEWQKFALEVFLILYRHLYFLLVLYDHGETITNQVSTIHCTLN